jgi:general secretion pathway protein A
MPIQEVQTPDHPLYGQFFMLSDAPFRLTPDPDFFYLTQPHLQALERIRYAIRTGTGFMWVLGEVGTGKTTLCRYLLKEITEQAHVAYIVSPSLSFRELLAAILDDLGLSYDSTASKKELVDRFRSFLLEEAQRRTVVVIDDAQTMPDETLEDLRLLSNLETDKEKLVQVLLIGQPELKEKLAQPHLRQLNQRIAIRCEIPPLSEEEVRHYVAWRLQRAGNRGQIHLSPGALRRLTRQSGGIPRLVNLLAEYALLAAYVEGTRSLEPRHVERAARELSLEPPPGKAKRPKRFMLAASAGILATAGLAWLAVRLWF